MSPGHSPAATRPRLLDPDRLDAWLRRMPKTALHVHLEGTLEPELAFTLAERNAIEPGSPAFPYADLAALRAAYRFADLGAFLDVYYAACGVLRTADDFHDLARAYGDRVRAEGIRRAELFFDPQTHTRRGVGLSTVVRGLWSGLADARAHGVDVALIACFLRDAPVGHADDPAAADAGFTDPAQATAWATLRQVLEYNQRAPADESILGVGLDSYETPYPPELFAAVFARARAAGLRCTAHAGEEGPPAYIRAAIDTLGVSRIDHGVRCTEDAALLERLAAVHDTPTVVADFGEPHAIPLTVCPRSNYALKVFPDPARSNLLTLLRAGVQVCVNSDDPAYFGGYALENYRAVVDWLDPSFEELRQLARNGVHASWMPPAAKTTLLAEIDAWFAASP
ncbi:MAG: adenosine deaminase family protein [Myxococcales bacterium]|nr:adenosine deaminase family protein [Myxococcales bacterium]MCB9753252.1 adenosine deaminase family protein [Myxococcales bacterium]